MNDSWDRLVERRVCFGHQSVGADIVEALSRLSGRRLDVVESREAEVFRRPVFAHFRVGRNRDPFSKCRDFSEVINAGVGNRIDVAFFKFCYVDITGQTDVDELFKAYQEIMADLHDAYPKVSFLHITVPLTLIRRGMLGWIREKIGGCDPEREDQVRRHAFNQLLRGVYSGTGRLFDLAKEESTFPDGRPSEVRYRGEPLPTLVPEYTDDGGHLNRPAAERMASHLLTCLNVAGTAPHRTEGGQRHSR